MHDVAARAAVSTATVSRVLSNPEKVSEATRRRVLKAVDQLGYSPNAAAKSLRTLTTRKLLVTVPDIAIHFSRSSSRELKRPRYARAIRSWWVILTTTRSETSVMVKCCCGARSMASSF